MVRQVHRCSKNDPTSVAVARFYTCIGRIQQLFMELSSQIKLSDDSMISIYLGVFMSA